MRDYEKYRQSMELIYKLQEQKLAKVDGIKVSTVYDCFGHCNQDNDPVFDIEFVSISGRYYHLWNVSVDRLVFKEETSLPDFTDFSTHILYNID